tara:strand:- start:661 stop:840 length:180 start_codon:yes stop_codon:yes gene_type:complete
MSDKLETWKAELEEQLKYKAQVEVALNQTTAKILKLQGGIQFAEESAQSNEVEVVNEEQ